MTTPTRRLAIAEATLPRLAVSGASITLDATASGRLVDVTTGASDSTITMPTGQRNGRLMIVRKADAGAGKVVVGSNIAWLFVQGDLVQLAYDSATSAWVPYDWRIAPYRQVWQSSDNFVNLPLEVEVIVRLIGGGGGGGSGRRGPAGSVRCGGGPGQPGGFSEARLRASLLGAPLSTVPINIGAAGNGGAAVASNSTAGAAGTSGGDTSFGTFATAQGGSGGTGGTTSAGTAGTSRGSGTTPATTPLNASTTGGSGATSPSSAYGGAGSPGAGITSADAASTGPAGGQGGYLRNPLSGGSSAGGAGNSQPTDFANGFTGGSGGGGGSSSTSTVGGTGGAGGWPGGSGGGGGASLDGSNSGAGGVGSAGAAETVTMF